MNRLPIEPTLRFLLAVLCIAGLAPGCAELSKVLPAGAGAVLQTGAAVVNRPKFSDADEERMARENAVKFDKENQMWDDPLLDTYLNGLVQRLAKVAHPRPYAYRIKVVRDASLNAFTFGGGYLYVHAGLLARMENEAQLQMVLGHEIAHVTESHVTKGIEGTYGIQLLGQIAASAASASGATSQLPAALLQKTYEYSMNAAVSGHGRAAETEADVVGIEYMVKTGHDPREAPKTFEQLLKEHGDQAAIKNFFYGSHPTNKARIEHLNGLIKSKYSQTTGAEVANTDEFIKRTRELVILVARMDYDNKRPKEAAALLEKALKAREDATARYFLGKIALDAADADRAIAQFRMAIVADDKLLDPYRELGMAYYQKGDSAKAIESLEKYLKLAPSAKDAERIRTMIKDLKD